MNKLATAFKGSGLARDDTTSRQSQPEPLNPDIAVDTVESPLGESDMVPGVRGEMLPANQLVSVSFKVTAKERYLWNLALTKSGQTTVGVLRQAMRNLIDKG